MYYISLLFEKYDRLDIIIIIIMNVLMFGKKNNVYMIVNCCEKDFNFFLKIENVKKMLFWYVFKEFIY